MVTLVMFFTDLPCRWREIVLGISGGSSWDAGGELGGGVILTGKT